MKSTLFVSSSNPVKYSSKVGASRESVAKTSPLGVKWYLISRSCHRLIVIKLTKSEATCLIFGIDHNSINVDAIRFRCFVLDDDSDLCNLVFDDL